MGTLNLLRAERPQKREAVPPIIHQSFQPASTPPLTQGGQLEVAAF
jgi:hypothetical protein